MKKLVLSVLLLLACGMTSYAQKVDPVVSKIIEIGQTDNQTDRHLDILSNRFGGRLVGSDAYENALDWAKSEFEKWGLEVSVEEAGEVPVGFNRGPWFGKMLGEDGFTLDFVTPSYTAGTKGVATGHVALEPKSREEFNRMKHTLKGAWVLIGGTNTGWAIDHNDEANQRRAKMLDNNEQKAIKNRQIMADNRANGTKTPLLEMEYEPGILYKEMIEAGILGVIQSSKVPLRALYDKSVVKDPNMTFDNLPTTVDIKLNEQQFEKIYKYAQERRRFFLEFQIRNHFKMGPIKFNSLVAKIKGTKYPNEYVMMSGHLDAYDVGTGGVDCGVGITPAMEAARMIMKAGGKPKRSMLFVLFAAEEFGLIGAKAWVDTHRSELDNISNLFNRDGGPTVPVGISVPEAMYDDFVKVSAPVNSINPDFPFEVKKMAGPINKPTTPGGHDGTVFMCEGIPAIGFTLADTKGYNFNYGEIWHTDRDVYTKSIPEYQEHTSVVTAVIAYGLANLDHKLSRVGLYK